MWLSDKLVNCTGLLEDKLVTSYYVFHDRVILFFADNFSMECRITMKFLHNFF